MWYDETGMPWHHPSPNIRSLDAALLYTGTVFFEGTNLTEGRGTSAPFQTIGAAWLSDAGEIARELNARGLSGVSFDSSTVKVEGTAAKWGAQTIPVITVGVTDRNAVVPYRVGLEMLRAIYRRHKGEFQWRTSSIDRLSGSMRVREAVELDALPDLIAALERVSRYFEKSASRYLIYPPRLLKRPAELLRRRRSQPLSGKCVTGIPARASSEITGFSFFSKNGPSG
jgi:uncharacterized protein YbbC (DUF1343 family)